MKKSRYEELKRRVDKGEAVTGVDLRELGDEHERRSRWWDTYNASLNGLRSVGVATYWPEGRSSGKTEVIGDDLIRSQAEYLKQIAVVDADVAHGPLEGE